MVVIPLSLVSDCSPYTTGFCYCQEFPSANLPGLAIAGLADRIRRREPVAFALSSFFRTDKFSIVMPTRPDSSVALIFR